MTMTVEEKAMMTRMVAVLAALHEIAEEDVKKYGKAQPVPASSIYVAFNTDMDLYERVTGAMVRLEWIERTSTTIKITAKGTGVAKKIAAKTGI